MTFHNYRLVCVNATLFRDGHPCEVCVGRSTLSGIRYRCYRDSLVSSAVASATIQLHRRRGTWEKDLAVAITLTDFARKRLLKGGLPAARTVVKPNFVTDPGYRTQPPSASNQVLYVGRISREKGVDRLLAAWQEAGVDGLELNIIGDAADSNITDTRRRRVRILGRINRDEVRARMLASRALVVPSISYEGQPMVILEALSAGLPVLHTDVGALSETCGGGGLSIGPGDVEQMVSRLQVLADGSLLDSVGHTGREEFERRFNEKVGLEVLSRIYASAAFQSPWRDTRNW